MSLIEFTQWLYQSRVSQMIQSTSWIIPTVQSIHIISIAMLIGSSLVLDLKLAGLAARTESSLIVFRRYMPWAWWGLSVLLATGLVMIVGEPERVMSNWVFWTKIALVVIAFVITLIMRIPMTREDLSSQSPVWALLVKPMGLLALAIWVLIIFAGRWIAYAR